MLNIQTFLTDCDEALKSKCLHCVAEIFHELVSAASVLILVSSHVHVQELSPLPAVTPPVIRS